MASEAYRIAASDGAIASFARGMKDAMTGTCPNFFHPEEHLLKYNLDQRPAHLLASDCTKFYNRSDEYFGEVRQQIQGLLSTWDEIITSRNLHHHMRGRCLDANFMRNILLCGIVIPDRSNLGYKPPVPEVLRYNKRIQTQDTSLFLDPHGTVPGQYPIAPHFNMGPLHGGAEAPTVANADGHSMNPTNAGWAHLFQSPDVAFGQDRDALAGVPDPSPATFLPTVADDPVSGALPDLECFYAQIGDSPENLALSSNADTMSCKQETDEESDSSSGNPRNGDEVCDPESTSPPLQDDGDLAESQPSHARNFASMLSQNCSRLTIPQAASSPPDALRWSVGSVKRRRFDSMSKPKIKFVKHARKLGDQAV